MAPYVIVSFTFVRLRLLIPGQSLYGCPPHLDCLQHIILGCPAGRMLFGLCLDLTAYATPYPLLNWTSSFCVFHPKYTWYFIPPLHPISDISLPLPPSCPSHPWLWHTSLGSSPVIAYFAVFPLLTLPPTPPLSHLGHLGWNCSEGKSPLLSLILPAAD